MSSFLMYLLAFVIVLSPLIFFHELGHYWAAKACGVHVERFSIGFGPKIVSWTDRSGTEWVFSWILLGGYVQMLGDANVASSVSKDLPGVDISKTMAGKSHLQRIAIAGAGPAVNYLLAFVMFVGLFSIVGKPFHSTTVGYIEEKSAYQAGVRLNDRIISVQDQPVENFEDIVHVLSKTPADLPLSIKIERNGQMQSLMCTPVPTTDKFWQGKMGAGPYKSSVVYVKQPLGKAIDDTLKMLDPRTALRSLKLSKMSGPIAIAQEAGGVWQQGLVPILFLMANLSLALGFFNLLPLPVLDGGMIVIEMLEWVIGRPLSTRVRQWFSIAAFAFLMALLLVLSWGDLMKVPAISKWVHHFMG